MSKRIIGGVAGAALILLATTGAFAAPVLPTPTPVLIPVKSSSHAVVPWVVIGCVSGTVLSAVIANWRDNRELTWNEAASCGILFWFAQPGRMRKVRR